MESAISDEGDPSHSHARAPEAPANDNSAELISERRRRINVHQNADRTTRQLKAYLRGELHQLSAEEVTNCAKVASQYELDEDGLLYYVSYLGRKRGRDQTPTLRLVVPSAMRTDILHLCHTDIQGGHQGINRTFEKLRMEYYWTGMLADVQRYVSTCPDCVSGKGRPRDPGESPGNITPKFPMQVVSMDLAIPLPESRRGNVALLMFQDTFTGYVAGKPLRDTSAQSIAEAYEEVIFRRFGASSIIRHDMDPRFMSDVFNRFRRMMGSEQRATLAYRPQANGQQERSIQTVIRSIKAYTEDRDQKDWDTLAELLMFALNTSYDHTRCDTPHYLLHGWDPMTTLKAMMEPLPARGRDRHAALWRAQVQRDYEYAQEWANKLQRAAQKKRADAHNQRRQQLPPAVRAGYQLGDAVWVYIPLVKAG